jgi:hypothetical protein
MNQEFIQGIARAASQIPGPLIVPWPERGRADAMRIFATFKAWHEFVTDLGLRESLPVIVTGKFERALKLHLMAWIDFDLIKVGELVALTTLELALKDRYGHRVKKSKRCEWKFADLLKFMVTDDGLTDDKLPMIQRYGGSVVPLVRGERKPTLAEVRNSFAHGDPFDGWPWSGMLELVRDLIEYAYRDWP